MHARMDGIPNIMDGFFTSVPLKDGYTKFIGIDGIPFGPRPLTEDFSGNRPNALYAPWKNGKTILLPLG